MDIACHWSMINSSGSPVSGSPVLGRCSLHELSGECLCQKWLQKWYLVEDLLFSVSLCSSLAVLHGLTAACGPGRCRRSPSTLTPHLFHGSCLGQGMAARACPTPSQEQAARGTGAAPALGVSLCLSQGQAGMWVWLSKAVAGQGCGELALLMAPGADMGGRGDGPVAQALKFGFLGWLACGESLF